MQNLIRVLGIETSCDETAIAIYDRHQGLLAHMLHSQATIHSAYGGVVPELASRDHIRSIIPLLRQTLQQAKLNWTDLSGIAYCAGPGLTGALLVGATVGRSLGWALSIPTLGIHHLEAHLLTPMLETDKPAFPFVALLVSGGHTLLATVEAIGCYHILGESLDDAAGEAFDKIAKLLGLAYPGGPAVAQLACSGNLKRFYFPRPLCDRPGLDFSFSGLKTFAANCLQHAGNDTQTRADIACAFQLAVVDSLVVKAQRALKQTGLKRLVVAGGVSANHLLRHTLQATLAKDGSIVYYPRPSFCTDNGAMIAYAGYQRLKAGQHDDLTIKTMARWPLDQLSALPLE